MGKLLDDAVEAINGGAMELPVMGADLMTDELRDGLKLLRRPQLEAIRAAATLEDCHGLLREYGVTMSDDLLRRIREFPSLDLLLRLAGHR
ncbi:MAG: hypothetical protein J6S26_05000 [Solobacterium sp.]|nr:hypothetical protein [Solobacterium sp.]